MTSSTTSRSPKSRSDTRRRLPEKDRIAVCPITGFSTYAESDDVNRCLQPLGVHRVLIVTSASHSGRALRIFRQRLPQYQFSAAAAQDPSHFGMSLVDQPRVGQDHSR